jgi:hypothetical protein
VKRISQAFKDFYFTAIVEWDAKVPGFQISQKKKLTGFQTVGMQARKLELHICDQSKILSTQPLMYFTTVM